MISEYASTSLAGLRVEATNNAYRAHIDGCSSLREHSRPCDECFSLCDAADDAAFAYGDIAAPASQQPAAARA